MSDEGGSRRRRRRRATAPQGTPRPLAPEAPGPPAAPPAAAPAPPAEPAPARAAGSPRPGKPKRTARPAGERGLRDLVGAGPSQLGVSGALRGRDVNRPTDDDLAQAERDIALVRRNWQPPAGAPPDQH